MKIESKGRGVFVKKSSLLLPISVLLPSQCSDFPVHAAIEIDGDYEYELNGRATEATIVKYTGPGGKVEIPAELGEKLVTVIGDDAFLMNNLTEVIIPESMISIGHGAFAGSGLTSLEFAGTSKVESIGNGAFTQSKLTEVIIPESVMMIGDDAFYANRLTKVEFAGSSKVESIGKYAFHNNRLEEVTIPKSVMTIGDWAFDHNELLTKVTIHNAGTSIGSNVFSKDTFSGDPKEITLYGYQTSTTKNYADEKEHQFRSLDNHVK